MKKIILLLIMLVTFGANATNTTTVIVKKGESLSKIALANGMKVTEWTTLVTLNNFEERVSGDFVLIFVGEEILIPINKKNLGVHTPATTNNLLASKVVKNNIITIKIIKGENLHNKLIENKLNPKKWKEYLAQSNIPINRLKLKILEMPQGWLSKGYSLNQLINIEKKYYENPNTELHLVLYDGDVFKIHLNENPKTNKIKIITNLLNQVRYSSKIPLNKVDQTVHNKVLINKNYFLVDKSSLGLEELAIKYNTTWQSIANLNDLYVEDLTLQSIINPIWLNQANKIEKMLTLEEIRANPEIFLIGLHQAKKIKIPRKN